jgi:NitT/TauT family transport system substrate-binding protein
VDGHGSNQKKAREVNSLYHCRKEKKMTKQILIGITVAVFIAGGCRKQSGGYSGPVERVTLGAEASLLSSSVWIADYKGYFKDEGLDVTLKKFDSGKQSFQAMLKGEVDLSTVAPTPLMFSSFERDDFCIFATFAHAEEDIKVIACKDKGISTSQDLIGKKIGTPAGTTGQFFVETYLIQNEIPASQVEIVDIAPSGLPGALANGEIDAIVIWEPHANNARQLLQNKAIRLPSSDVYQVNFNFMAMKEFAQDNPVILERFLRAIKRATIYINNNKQESQTIVARMLELDEELTAILHNVFTFEMSLNQSLIITIEDEARWAIRSKLTDKTEVPNYIDYIYIDAMEKVSPEAITIIR